jgi:hypothetical protein
MDTEDTGPKRPVSARKAKANAENAQRSTGPRTVEGKAKSRGNALRCGLYTSMPFPIMQGDLAEDPVAIENTVSAIVAGLAPRDYLEDLQATRVANCYLKGTRANAMEAQVLSGPLMTADGKSVDDTQPFVTRDAGALEQFIDWLTGERTVDEVDFTAVYFMLCMHLEVFDRVRVADPPNDPSMAAGRSRAEVERIIDAHLEAPLVWAFEHLEHMKDALNRVAAAHVEHTRGRLGDYDKLTRIDQRIGRELQRALAEYRRLQERDLDDDSQPFVETNPPPAT